jgi:hypothetical protein
MYWLILLNPDNKGKIYVQACDEDGVLNGFKTKREALASFEDAYKAKHHRGFEASMSACIHYMQFNPSVIKVRSYDDIAERLIQVKTAGPVSLRSVAGYMFAVPAIQPTALEMWENGTKPALIKEK